MIQGDRKVRSFFPFPHTKFLIPLFMLFHVHVHRGVYMCHLKSQCQNIFLRLCKNYFKRVLLQNSRKLFCQSTLGWGGVRQT